MHCGGFNTLTDKWSCRWIHRHICNPAYRGPPALGKAPNSHTLPARTLTFLCKSPHAHAFTQVCTCRRWSFTTLSRSLNVGHARMRLKDSDNPYVFQCWRRSLIFPERNGWLNRAEISYSKPLYMLIKTSAASNIKPSKNRGKNHGSCSKISKNYKATPAFESFISRNNCLFILCSLWICNCFWLLFHH